MINFDLNSIDSGDSKDSDDFNKSNDLPQIERHPIAPFFPSDAQVLFLGSFPPPKTRWCMDFFYPNLQNDFWRIFGLVFFQDRDFFLTPPESDKNQNSTYKPTRKSTSKRIFDREKIMEFLRSHKMAMYDTAKAVIREKGNASDASLRIVEQLDLKTVLEWDLPQCKTLLGTGEKAVCEILRYAGADASSKPMVGGSVEIQIGGKPIKLYRLPSSSRAYPLSIEKKAQIYEKVLKSLNFVHISDSTFFM